MFSGDAITILICLCLPTVSCSQKLESGFPRDQWSCFREVHGRGSPSRGFGRGGAGLASRRGRWAGCSKRVLSTSLLNWIARLVLQF